MKKDQQKKQTKKDVGATPCGCPAEKRYTEYEAGWKRALADYENLKRDMATQALASRERIKIDFVEQLLPVVDNFHQAVSHAPETEDAKLQNWLQGVLYIEKQFEDVLTVFGLERISVGDTFDPNLHEAVGEGEEMKEVQPGWKIGDRVIRPAKVITVKE